MAQPVPTNSYSLKTLLRVKRRSCDTEVPILIVSQRKWKRQRTNQNDELVNHFLSFNIHSSNEKKNSQCDLSEPFNRTVDHQNINENNNNTIHDDNNFHNHDFKHFKNDKKLKIDGNSLNENDENQEHSKGNLACENKDKIQSEFEEKKQIFRLISRTDTGNIHDISNKVRKSFQNFDDVLQSSVHQRNDMRQIGHQNHGPHVKNLNKNNANNDNLMNFDHHKSSIVLHNDNSNKTRNGLFSRNDNANMNINNNKIDVDEHSKKNNLEKILKKISQHHEAKIVNLTFKKQYPNGNNNNDEHLPKNDDIRSNVQQNRDYKNQLNNKYIPKLLHINKNKIDNDIQNINDKIDHCDNNYYNHNNSNNDNGHKNSIRSSSSWHKNNILKSTIDDNHSCNFHHTNDKRNCDDQNQNINNIPHTNIIDLQWNNNLQKYFKNMKNNEQDNNNDNENENAYVYDYYELDEKQPFINNENKEFLKNVESDINDTKMFVQLDDINFEEDDFYDLEDGFNNRNMNDDDDSNDEGHYKNDYGDQDFGSDDGHDFDEDGRQSSIKKKNKKKP